jgi:hypothetical protein
MKHSTMMEAVSILIQTETPFVLWDKPGTGKTKTVEAICRALQFENITLIAATRMPPDLGGYPVPAEDDKGNQYLEFIPAQEFFEAMRLRDEGKKVLLFFDEVSCAAPAVQSVLLRPLNEKRVGRYSLEGISMGAAANPPDCAAEGWELRPPMANRLVHLNYSLDAETFCQGMISGWPDPSLQRLPEKWRDGISQTRAFMASFVNARRSALHTMNETNGGGAWSSPRTLDVAALLLAATRSLGYKDTNDLPVQLVSGCIGEDTAREWVAYAQDMDLPDPEAILKDPDKLKIEVKRMDRLYATLTSVVAAVIAKKTKDRWCRAWVVLGRCLNPGKANDASDVAASVARILARRENIPDGMKKEELPEDLTKFGPFLKKAGVEL